MVSRVRLVGDGAAGCGDDDVGVMYGSLPMMGNGERMEGNKKKQITLYIKDVEEWEAFQQLMKDREWSASGIFRVFMRQQLAKAGRLPVKEGEGEAA